MPKNKKHFLLKFLSITVCVIVFLLGFTQVFAQTKKYATIIRSSSTDNITYGCGFLNLDKCYKSSVENKNNAINGNNQDYARLTASAGGLLSIGSYGSELEIEFTTKLKVNQTSYIRMDADDKILSALLGGSLGDLLSNVVGAILVGNLEFTIEARNGSTSVLKAESKNKLVPDSGIVKVVKDKNGYTYIALTPTKEYNRVYIKTFINSSLIGGDVVKNIDVYNVFTYEENISNNCGLPIATSFDGGGGLTLDVATVNNQNLNNAIDDDVATFSVLKDKGSLNLSLGATISQYFYFSSLSSPTSNFTIKVGAPGSVLNVSLLGELIVNAYQGSSLVYSRKLSGGLLNGTDLLGLLGSNQTMNLTFAPGVAYDKVEIKTEKAVSVSLLDKGINIYDIRRYDNAAGCSNPNVIIPDSTPQPLENSVCATNVISFTNADFPHNATNGNNESFASLLASGSTDVNSGKIRLSYPQNVAANRSSYIRISLEEDILKTLLGGDKYASFSSALLSSHIIDVAAFDSNNVEVFKRSSNNGFANAQGVGLGSVRVVQDDKGRYYLDVKPATAYRSIQISNRGTVIGDIYRLLKVYTMCQEIGTNVCYAPQFTAFSTDGLASSLFVSVNNPYYAISPYSSFFSEIKNSEFSKNTSIRQNIFFSSHSEQKSELRIKMAVNPENISENDFFSRYEIITYLAGIQQESFTLKQGLNSYANALTLLKTSDAKTFIYKTTKVFDQVDVVVKSLLSSNVVSPSVKIYEVQRVGNICSPPRTTTPFIESVCAITIVDARNADDVDVILDGNIDSYATLRSHPGIAGGIASYKGYVEMSYGQEVPAGKTSYIRFEFDHANINGFLSGSMGNTIQGMFTASFLGNRSFEIIVKNAAGAKILEKSSKTIGSNPISNDVRVVIDRLGRTYLAVTPQSNYQSIGITTITESAAGFFSNIDTAKVYSMCYVDSNNPCMDAFVTSYELNGLALNTTNLNGAGVKNPQRAIDNITTNYSEIKTGTLLFTGSVKQFIYFNEPSKPEDNATIKFKIQGGTINTNLLGAIEIKAYLGETVVKTQTLENGIINGVNVTQLLTNNQLVELPFIPGVSYDRISVGLKAVAAVSNTTLQLYSVERECRSLVPNQTLISWISYNVNGNKETTTVRGGEEVEYTIHVRNDGNNPVNNLQVEDKLPQGIAYKSATTGSVSEGTYRTNYAGTINPGEVKTFALKVDVDNNLNNVVEIKNVAFTTANETNEVYGTHAPVSNSNPTQPNTARALGVSLFVENDCDLDRALIISTITDGKICRGSSIKLEANIIADSYLWYLNGDQLGEVGQSITVDRVGTYSMIYVKNNCNSPMSDVFVVSEKPVPLINITGSTAILVKENQTIIWPTFSAGSPNTTITVLNAEGNIVTPLPGSLPNVGTYVYTIVATNTSGCTTSIPIKITVFDTSACPPMLEKTYATQQVVRNVLLGSVTNPSNAIDGKYDTFSVLNATLGAARQDLLFANVVAAGTPVSVKIGKNPAVLGLVDGLTIVGLDENNNEIGSSVSIVASLANLLMSNNTFEFTFIPTANGSVKAYKGVRVVQSAVLNLGGGTNLYGAYYQKNVTQYSANYCNAIGAGISKSVLDVFAGASTTVANVATVLASVENPWNCVKEDNTFTTMHRIAGVLSTANLTVVFKQQAMLGDELHIVIEKGANDLLSLDLIKGFKIQRYLDNQPVGSALDETSNLLSLALLGLGNNVQFKIIVAPYDQPYDRVTISCNNVLSILGENIKIYQVKLAPKIDLGIDINRQALLKCKDGVLVLKQVDVCTSYDLFKTQVGGIPLSSLTANEYKLPNDLESITVETNEGNRVVTKKYRIIYIETKRNGCVVGERQAIYLDLKNCLIKSNLNIKQKIKVKN